MDRMTGEGAQITYFWKGLDLKPDVEEELAADLPASLSRAE